ncbi:MAG: hypothetical protein ACKVOU_13820 [Cytophagales bacterium]
MNNFANPLVKVAAGFANELNRSAKTNFTKLSRVVKALIVTHPAYSSRVAWL